MNQQEWYRRIPGTDTLLMKFREECEKYGTGVVENAIRENCERVREQIRSGNMEEADRLLVHLERNIQNACLKSETYAVRKVINATGVLLHTNLGRSPIGEWQKKAVLEAADGYTNLEFDLDSGKRGSRSRHFRELLSKVTCAEDGIAVNNNAAALLLALTALTKGKEVIVSRGELVEIGGHFRIPEVMELGGCQLREVGTTNKTRLSDYEKAICENTGAILKVHTSNYRIVGFTEETAIEELVSLGKKHGIPVIVDLGSGSLIPLEKFGFVHEPCVQEVIQSGADLVCFSGDKLLGGPQAGILAGKEEYIRKMEKHPLIRALRLDKMVIAALSATFSAYLDEEKACSLLPLLSMMRRSREELREQAELVCSILSEKGFPGECEIMESLGKTGGGSLPTEEISGYAVVLSMEKKGIGCERLKKILRTLGIPVIAYSREEKVWLDMRTVTKQEAVQMAEEIAGFFSGGCL